MRAEADTPIWVSELVPTARQNWSAAALVAVVLVVFEALVPIATRPAAELNSFFPTLDAIVLITDLITAVLLLTQFSISRSRSLLALAFAYLFTALIVVPHALTFAGAFSPTGLLGANRQTGSWLFIFWHFGFSAALLAYAALRRREDARTRFEGSTLAAIGWCVASAVLARGPSALRARPVADGRRLRRHPRARLQRLATLGPVRSRQGRQDLRAVRDLEAERDGAR